MSKRITINEKLFSKIDFELSQIFNLNNFKSDEFELIEHRPLFQDPPENWSELEKVICDYQIRIESEVSERIKKLLTEGNAR